MGESVTIRTGKMGHGKTLNAIREIDQQAVKENRIVYYHNIDGLQPDKLKAQWYEFENPHEWYKLPDHCIIVIDEAQRFFGTRDPRSPVPPYISELETIRHQGQEIVFITQDHRFLDVNIRRLCGCHIHFRRILGSNKIARHEFLEASDYDKPAVLANSDKTYIKLDKSMFGLYKSASGHHFKVKLPKKLYLFIFIIILVIYLGYSAYSKISSKGSDELEEVTTKPVEQSLMNSLVNGVKNGTGLTIDSSTEESRPMTLEEYLNYYKPRIEGLPHTAPAYDELTKPQTYPRLSCLITQSKTFIKNNKDKISLGSFKGEFVGCSCYTQQATLYKTPFKVCLNIVENGYFDSAKPDRNTIDEFNKDSNRLAKK